MNYAAPSADLKKAKPTRTSELLREFALSLTGERVSIGDIVTALGDRGLGVLIAIFALPNILPSTVPFGNVLTGIPPLIFAVHLPSMLFTDPRCEASLKKLRTCWLERLVMR